MDDIPVYTPYVCTGFVYITKTRVPCISITRRLNNWHWILVHHIKYPSHLKLEGKIWKKKIDTSYRYFFLSNILNSSGNVSHAKFYFKTCKHLKVINNI